MPIWRKKIEAGIGEAAHRTSSTIERLQAERDLLYGKLRRMLAQADALVEQREILRRYIFRSSNWLVIRTTNTSRVLAIMQNRAMPLINRSTIFRLALGFVPPDGGLPRQSPVHSPLGEILRRRSAGISL